MTEGPIPLRASNKKACVWDVDDVARLRSCHGICGMLTATLPHLSQQNIFLGVPLLLMPEEVVFLVQKGLACLRKISAHDNHNTVFDVQHGQDPSGTSKATLTGVTYTVHIAAPSSQLEWYWQSLYSFTTLASAREAGIWDYPSTPEECARCAVFRDLREKGYYLGIGIKFGGNYLVYPGDALHYHSHFVASIIPSPRTPLCPMEIVAHGRLGTGTKKSHLLREWDEGSDVVTCYSIEWAGFG
ncbi:tRNA intron endonuclease [Pisolithus marmoratus]|nr:tRNA intron endonuclease [Pisolithus marmoratus]